MSIKVKAIDGFIWSFSDAIARQFITLIFGIILARLLTPREFGLIGMATIIFAITNAFLDSGFGAALIRKKECSQSDYSTVFIYNLIVSAIFFLLIVFCAGGISNFFNEPQLKLIIQVLAIGIIINAFALIQQTILIKIIDFKSQTYISLISNILSGSLGVFLAFTGCGVWSLVVKMLFGSLLSTVLLWTCSKWKPLLKFSLTSFRELFAFGRNLLFSQLLETLYRNVNSLVIGKFYSAVELGFYTRADHFSIHLIGNFTNVIQRVSYPVLSAINEDVPKLKLAYKKIVKSAMLITFMVMLGIAAVAKPMILALIGGKWLPTVVYLQILCLIGILYPLHALNLNILNVMGHSNLYLRLEIIKKILAVPIIGIGIFCGIKSMLLAMLVSSIISFYLNGYWSGKLIGYSIIEQLKDVYPSFILAFSICIIVYYLGVFIKIKPLLLLCVQVISGLLLFFGYCEIYKYKDYMYIKNGLKSKFTIGLS